jgi:phospholipid transport system substrate-binding protein
MAARSGLALVVVLTALVVNIGTSFSEPAPAIDTLRRHLDSVVATLQSPSFLEKDAEARRDAVRRAGGRLFNWEEMSRRALGPHWDGRTPAERRKFADHFARVAERSYLWQVERLRAGQLVAEPIRYLGESTDGRETIVHTKLAYLRDLPADFRMQRRSGRWEVCDVAVDGVSATENYRAQFDRLLARGSYRSLVSRMAE